MKKLNPALQVRIADKLLQTLHITPLVPAELAWEVNVMAKLTPAARPAGYAINIVSDRLALDQVSLYTRVVEAIFGLF